MLTESELASMRETLGDSLAGTAVIFNSAFVSDGGGGGTTTWTAAGTVDCRVAPTGGAEEQQGDRLQPETEVIFTIPQGGTITPDSQIGYGGRTYTVTALRAPRTWEISRRVEAKELE
jgi:head-tail adaptor